MLTIVFIAKRIFYFVVDNWRVVLTLVGVVALLVLVGLAWRGCRNRGPQPKLDQAETIAAQQAIARDDRRVMVDILANSAVREAGIDNSIKAAEQAADAARRDYSAMTNDQLAAELEARYANK